MYEQPKTSIAGRIVWLIISLLIIGGIVWLILWFFFWRSPSVDTTSTSDETSQTKEEQSSGTSTSANSSSSSKTTESTTTSNSASTPTSLGQVVEETDGAAELVNTGPGDLATPIILTIAGGIVLYQIRLRRRFAAEVNE